MIIIFSKLSLSSTSPADFINPLITCKRLYRLGMNPPVLSRASSKMFSIRAKNWSDSSHRFVNRCGNAGSLEACFFLGMIQFYCVGNRGTGASLLAKAALRSHAQAIYALSIMQFNGSGAAKTDKDFQAGVSFLRTRRLPRPRRRHTGARTLPQDGYGVCRNIPEGRHLLVLANTRDLAYVLYPWTVSSPHSPDPVLVPMCSCRHGYRKMMDMRLAQSQAVRRANPVGVGWGRSSSALFSDFGCYVPPKELHPANRILLEWFALRGGLTDPVLRMCAHAYCGLPETRSHEFRRCSVCEVASYCSRGCQVQD